MTEEEKTATLPSDVSDFLGMGQREAGGSGDSAVRPPSFAGGTDDFDERTKKERQARFKASADMLFSTDVSKLDDAGASALYQSVTEGLFGIPDEDGTVAFGKRATKDPRANIDMLRKFVKGDYTLIEDPEYTKWRQMDEDAKFQYAREQETIGNKIKSNLKGERGFSIIELAGAGMPGAQFGNVFQNMEAPNKSDVIRRTQYETLTDEEKAAYRADVIGDYEEKLSRRQTLATFLQFAHGLSDRAGYLLAKSFRDGTPDAANIEGLPEDERDRVYAAFSLMRGDQKKGRVLGIKTDFTDDTAMNRLQLGLYGFQQSVVGLVTDTGEMARDAAMWTYAKCALDEADRKAFFKGWDANVRAEQAMKQNLPDAGSIWGEAFQGVAENLHWFIPYSMIGKGGKMVTAARGIKGEQGFFKGLAATLRPMRLGGALKEEKATLEAGKAAMESAAAATRAAWTLDVNGAKKLGEMGSAILSRQMAAVDRYTQMLRGIDKDLAAAKWWKDAAGTTMWAAGEASAFSAFASEYIANADAAGISREESVLTAAAVGLVNAKIEQLYVPGLESSLTPAQVKSLTFAAMAQAIKTDGAAGFRKWLANRVSKGVTEGVKVTLTEGAVEEPLQQMAMEHGKAFDKLCQELRKDGKATLANEAKALWDSFAATLPNDYATFIDTAADMVPSSLGFGVTTIGNMTRRQHVHNVLTRHANRRAGAKATDTMLSLDQRGEDPSKAFDYDAGLVDVIQQAVNVRTAVEKHWQGEEDGGEAENPHRFEEAITAARRAWRDPQTGDAVQEIADAAGVDVKTAEVMAQYLQTEAEATAFSPQARAWTSLNMSLADIDEATIKTVLPGYVDGSFASDPENGIYSGRVRMDDGTEKTIAYRVGDFSDELRAEADENAKIGSAFGDSFNERHEELGDGIRWDMLSDAQRYQEALFASNAARMGSGVFELTDSKGQKVRVNADSVIRLANGHIADIGYGPAATQATVRHETFHSLWQFVRGTLADADVQQLAKTLGIDVTADNWERKLDERMAHEMERYASGHYVSHAVSSRFDKMLDSWAGKLIKFFGKFGPSDEVTDPRTGKPYQLKGLYDSILRGELGSGTLGVELRKVPAQPATTASTASTSSMPVEVTDADRAEAEAQAQAEAAKEETPAPTAPTSPAPTVTTSATPSATAEHPASASTPNQRYYKVGLPNSPVKLVGRLEVRDAESGVITSTDADYHDRGNQNRDDKSEESRALVEKIGANPDPLQVGTVQPIANNGIVWLLNNSNVIIGNHRVNGVRLAYEKGTAGDLEKFVREDAAKRGIEIGDDVKKPLLVFVLERIESPDGKADVHEVVRLANESQNRGFNVREQALNDAKILTDNNLLPRMAFRADGRIDETKSGDAIGKFRQESGAQGMIAEDGSLTEEGQTRIQNAALAALLGGEGNGALLQKIMSNAGRLDMQNEVRALMKMTPELMALAEAKPGYDLRGPLAEALQLFTEWRDKDETARVEKGKTRHDWRETKNGSRVRGVSWDQFMSQGDMFRTPSDEAKILGDLFARAEAERSFDREDVESAVGKKRAIDLISDYLTDYIKNARAVNTDTEDMFGGTPATRAEVMAAQRATGGVNGARFSVAMRETLDPAAWGDLSRTVKVVGDGKAPISLAKGGRIKDIKGPLYDAAVDNFKRQPNYREIDGRHYLEIDGSLIEVTRSGINHGLDRRYELNGYASALLGDILNNSVEVPNVESPMHYRIGKMDVGRVCYVLVTTKDSDGIGTVQNIEVLNSVNAKADGTAQGFNLTNAIRPTEESISNIRDAWQQSFLQNLVRHNIDKLLSNPDAPVARQREAVIEKYKGTAEWLMAPNGAKSNLDENQWVTVRTPAFKRWFGDWEKDPAHASKIVDANGEPIVVYRGAPFDPLAQEPGKGVIKPEAYFTANPEYAKRYKGENGSVRAYYLNIRHPFDIRNPECEKDFASVYPGVKLARGKSGALDWAEAATVDGEFLKENFGDKYDGVIFDEASDWAVEGNLPKWRGLSYVPLDGGAQVKSATDNNGDFSKNPDIRYSLAPNPNLREDIAAALRKNTGGDDTTVQMKRHDEIVFSDNLPFFEFLGLPNTRVVSDVVKVRKFNIKHHLTPDQIADLPNRYNAPVAVMRDGSSGYVLLTDMMGMTDNGETKPVRIFLRPRLWKSGEVVFVATAMAENAKDEKAYYEPIMKHGLLYADENKVAGLALEEETESILRTQASGDDVLTSSDYSWWSTRVSIAQSSADRNGLSTPAQLLAAVAKGSAKRKEEQLESQGESRYSIDAPRSGLIYPQLRGMSDEELVAAAVAARIALGKSDKVSDRSVRVKTVQNMMRRLHPDWDTTKIGVESQRVMTGAQKLAKRIRDDLGRGVSDSLVLKHLPSAMREQFGREMRQEAREGARLGAFGVRANTALEERQAQIVEDAVRVQTGLDSSAIENAYGINLSETIMHLAENRFTEEDAQQGTAEEGEESGNGEDSAAAEERTETTVEIDAKVKAVVDEIVEAARQQTEIDEKNRQNREAAAARDAANEEAARSMDASEETEDEGEGGEEGVGSEDEGDVLAEAVKKSALDLENPRHLARFVAELARRDWIKEHGLAKDADVWRDLVAVQFLRKTAQSVYAKLVRDLTYSRSRETAMSRIAKLDNVPTVAGLLSEMEFLGALVNANRIRETQKEMCTKLEKFLKKEFGARGRFAPDKEEGKRKVSAEAELRARYMRKCMWFTPDAAAEEARQLQETLDALSVDFKDAGRDVDQSREFVETIRKLNVLREFGALRYKPVGEIEAAVQWWQDFARGESDDIVREMSDRDIRTKKAAHLLAIAFADPKRTTIRESGKADALNRFITGHMGFISLLQDCMRHASDADAAAVKDIVDYIAREVQKAGDRSEAEKRRHNDAFHSAVESIYGKSFNAVMKAMMAPDKRFAQYMGVIGGKRVTPTKGRALQLLVSLLQEGRKVQVEDEENPGQTKTVWEGGYHKNIEKHHREGQAAEIMKLLDPADMNMLKWLGQWYENNRSDLSGVCHSLFGIGVYAELPNYFPVKMMLETQGLEKGQGVGWTIFPKALTPRVRNERDFDTSADIFSMWASRMEEAAQWKHHARLGLEMRGIFGRAELREAVRANHGAAVDDLMQGFITDILAGHGAYDRSTAGVQYFSDQIRGWTALCALGGNIGVMAKQTTSIPAFGFEIGLVNTAKYIVNAFTPEGMAAMGKIWDSEQRRTRWNLGSSEAVRNALSQQNASWLKRALQKSMITTKLGDVVPALVVGQGIYRDCLDRGMSEEDAMAETWSIIERTQQSGRMENQTSIQRRNKLGRIMFQFLSTQQQYLQYEMRAIREVIARPDSVKRWGNLGRAILLNHFILSSAYYWVGQLYKYALGQEPPEDELKDWLITCLLGPYGSLFVAGFCCKYTLERAIKGYSIKGGSSMLPMEAWLKNQVNDGAKLLEAIFDSNGNTWDNMREAAGRWMSDSNSVVRDLRKIYRYRVKEEQQKKK